MDGPSPALLRPRLRLLRRSPSPRIQDTSSEATPQPGPSSARPLFAALHDDESDEFPTPRMLPKPIVALNGDSAQKSYPGPSSATDAPAETPAVRLRALLARESRSQGSTTPALPPPPPSDEDSVTGPTRFGSSTSSVTRESLKDIFSRALREPGDTPEKTRQRRNSFDGSSMEITPVVGRDRGQRRAKAARRSLSDEEAEKPKHSRQSDHSSRSSTAVTFDTLRARLMASQSQLMDQKLSRALDDRSSLASTSTSNINSLQLNPTRVAPSVTTLTPHPSFQMTSQLAFQSNLLEQDSEMQRAMGDVLNSETEDAASMSAPNIPQSTAMPSDSSPSSSLSGGKNGFKLEHRRTNHELDSSASNSSVNGRTDGKHHSQEEEHSHQHERGWNHPRPLSRSGTPETRPRHSQDFHRRLSQEFRSPSHAKSFSHESPVLHTDAARPRHKHLERRSSIASLRVFDDSHSSRPSSISSQADYRDQISELERERNHEREREWNKRHPPPRPSSSLSSSSNHSFSHSHTHSPRSSSTTPYLAPTHASLQRKSSRTSLRSDSPASLASSHNSLDEREQEEQKETKHERERNWNSPRPQWSASQSPPTSGPRTRNNSLRATSSLTRLAGSNDHHDVPRESTKLYDVSPKVGSSTTPSTLLHKAGDRPVSSLDESAAGSTKSTPLNSFSPGKSPGATSRFGWNFSRSPLLPLELGNRHRTTSSPTPGSIAPSRASGAVTSSQIPVRSRMKSFSSVGHATSDMSFTNVVEDESSIQQDYQNEFSEVVEPRGREEPAAIRNPWGQEDMVLASDEESINDPTQSTTPKTYPSKPIPEEVEADTETEVLTSPSPQGSPRFGGQTSIPNDASLQRASDPPRSQTPNRLPEVSSVSAAPPGTSPPAQLPTPEASSSLALLTPPRQTSFGSSILDFRTPSPPHDLPDLPGPPSSSDDDALGVTPMKDRRIDVNSNSTLTKTPKPPGAWAATPLPPKFSHRSSSPAALFSVESTPPAFTSTPLPRANSLPPAHEGETDNPGEDGLLTPVGTLPRAGSLPLRTPAPPGAWMATPSQSALLSNAIDQSQYGSIGRRKGLLKVRFDVAESDVSATEGYPSSPLSAIRLTNPELPLPRHSAGDGADDTPAAVDEVSQMASTSAGPRRPSTPERPTTPISRESGPSPRSLRRSPAVRLVDAYGRERVDIEGTATTSMNLPIGHTEAERKTTTPLSTPHRSLVRIVDAMGKEVDDAVEVPDTPEDRTNRTFEADVSVVSDDSPVGHTEALVCMRKTLRDLAKSLSDADRSEELELNSSHLEQLEEVSQAARLARNQLAHNLHLETAKEQGLRNNSKITAWTHRLVPVTKKPWNMTLVYCAVIIQLLIALAMWRYANAEARRLFHTIYYEPLYPEFTPIQGSSCFSGTLSTSRSWTLLDSYETVQREGWRSIVKETLRAMRHVGDQAWERWGEHAHFEKPT